MSKTTVIDFDEDMLSQTLFHSAPGDQEFAIEEVQDCTDIADINKELYNSINERTPMKHMQRVASIPMIVWMDLDKKGITKDRKKFARWLNDPDNQAFRTRPGRI